jgi:hypothetical protein
VPAATRGLDWYVEYRGDSLGPVLGNSSLWLLVSITFLTEMQGERERGLLGSVALVAQILAKNLDVFRVHDGVIDPLTEQAIVSRWMQR